MEENNQELSKRERKRLNREKKREEESKKVNQDGLFKKLLFVGLVVVFAYFVWNFLQGGTTTENTETNDFASASSIRESDQVKGNPEAKLVLIEYGDFQCPACKSYYPVINEISEIYKDELAIVFRHFPLTSHRNAVIASIAAEAAGRQDAFWQMHDLLFERQELWSNVRDPKSDFVSYAEELGLNVDQFESDIEDNQIRSFVENAYSEGIVLGVNSTPTFILNGQDVRIPPTVAAFQNLIDQAISQLPESSAESTDSAELQE